MYYRYDADNNEDVSCINECPYLQSTYRAFPPGQFPGGTMWPGFGPGNGPPGGFPGFGPGYGPPSGSPGFGQGYGPPSGPPGFGQGYGFQGGPPGPPPLTVPVKQQAQIGVNAVDSGSLRFCIYKYVYIWLENGRSFWAWLNFVGPMSISGWRWNGRRWIYFGMDTRNIDSFVCY